MRISLTLVWCSYLEFFHDIDFVREDRLMTDAQFLRYLLIVHSRSDRIDNIKVVIWSRLTEGI